MITEKFNVFFDSGLNLWCFDYHGDWVTLEDAKNEDEAIEQRDLFLMDFGTDADNDME